MTQAIDGTELWRQVPPEEKIELLSHAHSVGVVAALSVILCGGTMAVGLHAPWFLWSSLLMAPLVFQIAAGRAWRGSRPKMMLEYLGARSAARRFAFTAKAQDLSLKLIFKAKMEEMYDQEHVTEQLEATIAQTRETTVWVALFGDAVIMLSERAGGAEAEFAQPISEKLGIEVKNGGSNSDYNNEKEIYLSYAMRNNQRKIKLTSKYSAAMVVFEKALLQRVNEAKALKAALVSLPASPE